VKRAFLQDMSARLNRIHPAARGTLLVAFGVFFLVLIISLAPAQQASKAAKVGNEACLICHDAAGKEFSLSAHARGHKGKTTECESCHGPGSAHADDPQKANIRNPEKMDAAEANETCLSCHVNSGKIQHWPSSRHAAADVRCTGCHEVHAAWTEDEALRNTEMNENCFQCHAQVRKSMVQRSSHPLRYGQMQCSSCHSPHGSAGEKSLIKPTVNQTCYTCHMEKRGPFLFEHAPVREDCLTCHVPHGSNNTMLLKAQTARLCQSCHLLGHHQTVAAQPGQMWVQNRACANCHAQIHGSNHPSGAIFLR